MEEEGLREPQPRLDRDHGVVRRRTRQTRGSRDARVRGHVVGHEQAELLVLAQVVGQAPDRENPRARELRARGAGADPLEGSAAVVAHRDRADTEPSHPADHLAAIRRVGDAPRVDQLVMGAEGLRAFEEERPLLRVIEGKALVDVDLQRIRLDLAVVGIQRDVRGERARHAVADIEAHVLMVIRGPGGSGRVEGPRRGARARGVGLRDEPAAAVESREPFEVAGLEHDVARDRNPVERPCAHLVVLRDLAADPEPPRVRPFGEAQRAQGNRHLCRPAVVVHLRLGVPRRVPAEVGIAAIQDAVELHAVRVHPEDVGAMAIEIGVEMHRDVIVIEDVVARREAGPHPTGVLVQATNAKPNVRVAEEDMHVGGFGWSFALADQDEPERADGRSALPVGLVEHAVQRQRPGRAHRDGARALGGECGLREERNDRDGEERGQVRTRHPVSRATFTRTRRSTTERDGWRLEISAIASRNPNRLRLFSGCGSNRTSARMKSRCTWSPPEPSAGP